MEFITPEYLALNKQLHEENKHFGNNGAAYLKEISDIIRQTKTLDILDYGCGKSALANNLPFEIRQYDPAIEKYSSLPEPAEFVICTDVLEHIEPEHLENVIDHIASLTKKYAFFVISIEKAWKTLPDGRNAHLIIEHPRWWLEKLYKHYQLLTYQDLTNRIMVLVQPVKKEI